MLFAYSSSSALSMDAVKAPTPIALAGAFSAREMAMAPMMASSRTMDRSSNTRL